MHNSEYNPVACLKVYARGNGDKAYIEIHNIKQIAGQFVEGAGRPLTLSAYSKLMMLAGSSNIRKEKEVFTDLILRDNILCYEPAVPGRYICWYEKARQRNVKFHREGVYYAWMPATLYFVRNEELYIYALKSNSRPTLRTQLYKMPLPNLKNEAQFCWGNVNTKKMIADKTIDQEMDVWTGVVWNSQFDYYNGTEYMKIIKELVGNQKRYPKKLLEKTDKNLKTLLEL